jgi:phosphoesterase RecJ-like protein
MSDCNTHDFMETARRLASWRRPLLVTHEKPDGDALGSLVAMRALLQSQGTHPTALLFEPIPARYELFNRFPPISILGRDLHLSDLDACDAVVVLDTCAYTQLRPIADWLRAAAKPKLAIDHHVTRDALADSYLADEPAAATCLILYDFARAANWPIDADIAEALFIGMAMDTGWFRHSNTDHRVLAAAADLAARGVRPHQFYESLFLRESPGRVRLLGAAVATMELFAGGQAAVMTLPTQAITDAGATHADTEDIVNEPLRIASVVVSVLLVEHDDGAVRAGFRSKPPPDVPDDPECAPGPFSPAGEASVAIPLSPSGGEGRVRGVQDTLLRGEARPDIDVAALAQTFGGGGHKRAAGARIPGTLAEVRRSVVEFLTDQFPRRPTS